MTSIAALVEVHAGEALHAGVPRLNRGAGVASGAGGIRHAGAGADLERHRQRHMALLASNPGMVPGVDGEADCVQKAGWRLVWRGIPTAC